jgi:glycosyltransferase involved in cell wall biosynthesis
MSPATLTIAIPTYNNERWMAASLDSLLAQDLSDFEVHVWDDASTDKTYEIVSQYARKDHRIHGHRYEKNIGAVANFNESARAAKSEYFMWGGDHDLYHQSFLSSCLEVLQKDASVAIVYPLTMEIDVDGRPLGVMPDRIDTRGLDPYSRYSCLIWNLGWCNLIMGVIRRDALMKTRLLRAGIASDQTLLVELALEGPFAQIQNVLYYRRRVRPVQTEDAQFSRHLSLARPRGSFVGVEASRDVLLKGLAGSYIRGVLRSDRISWLQKLRAAMSTLGCFRVRYHVWWCGWSRIEMWLSRWQRTRCGRAMPQLERSWEPPTEEDDG